ncbi:MAG: ABC transporter ATP-binding protein [Lentisphaeria bacterium]|nr:ABC transporter ATP-binding protein [Lentisphaeria bacterium]
MKRLEVKNLNIAFCSGKDRTGIVGGVSFSISPGEILALVGESGCGKSISCLALTRLLPVPPAEIRADAITFHGSAGPVDLLRASNREMRRIRGGGIAYIFQEPSASLNPVFRIGDQIAEAVALHRPQITDLRGEVLELLRQVGIPDPESRIDAYPHELSGGMQQRVMIAMALAGDPELLIADEPTTALDVTIQAQILELIDRMRKERNMAVILVTHNLGIVAELADRVAVMYAGNLVETAPVKEVLEHPCHPYTAALLKAVPRQGGGHQKLDTIPGNVPPPGRYPAGCRFSDRCGRCAGGTEAQQQQCREIPPELTELRAGHFCSCHQPLAEGDMA